jgi:phosphoribosyl-AMP cyclohydrolase
MCLEATNQLQLDFQKLNALAGQNVLPVVVQYAATGQVLLLAYTNQAAFDETRRTGELVLWSTSRNKLWRKGSAESGNTFAVKEMRVNCEQNSLLYLVEPAPGATNGGMCHTKNATNKNRTSCFYRVLKDGELIFID